MNGFIRQEKKYRLGFVRCFKKHKKISNSKFKNLVFSIYYYLYERFMPIFFLCSVLIGIFGLIYHLFSWPIFFSFLGSYFFLLAVLSFFTFSKLKWIMKWPKEDLLFFKMRKKVKRNIMPAL